MICEVFCKSTQNNAIKISKKSQVRKSITKRRGNRNAIMYKYKKCARKTIITKYQTMKTNKLEKSIVICVFSAAKYFRPIQIVSLSKHNKEVIKSRQLQIS